MKTILPALGALLLLTSALYAGQKPEPFWNVDDLKPGLKGFGQTVMKGTKIETFEVEILGVLKNTAQAAT